MWRFTEYFSYPGRTIVLSQSSAVSFDGHVMLSTGDVQHNWLDVSNETFKWLVELFSICLFPVHQKYTKARWIFGAYTGLWNGIITSNVWHSSNSTQIHAKGRSDTLCRTFTQNNHIYAWLFNPTYQIPKIMANGSVQFWDCNWIVSVNTILTVPAVGIFIHSYWIVIICKFTVKQAHYVLVQPVNSLLHPHVLARF